MVYQWCEGARYSGVDPQTAGEVLEKLEADGGLTAQRLVDASRPADAPLHGCFEWDDRKAAEEFRRAQGRTIIRSLVTVDAGTDKPVRAYFNIEATSPVYKSTQAIIKSKTDAEKLLEMARRDARTFADKYQTLRDLCDSAGPALDAMRVFARAPITIQPTV